MTLAAVIASYPEYFESGTDEKINPASKDDKDKDYKNLSLSSFNDASLSDE